MSYLRLHGALSWAGALVLLLALALRPTSSYEYVTVYHEQLVDSNHQAFAPVVDRNPDYGSRTVVVPTQKWGPPTTTLHVFAHGFWQGNVEIDTSQVFMYHPVVLMNHGLIQQSAYVVTDNDKIYAVRLPWNRATKQDFGPAEDATSVDDVDSYQLAEESWAWSTSIPFFGNSGPTGLYDHQYMTFGQAKYIQLVDSISGECAGRFELDPNGGHTGYFETVIVDNKLTSFGIFYTAAESGFAMIEWGSSLDGCDVNDEDATVEKWTGAQFEVGPFADHVGDGHLNFHAITSDCTFYVFEANHDGQSWTFEPRLSAYLGNDATYCYLSATSRPVWTSENILYMEVTNSEGKQVIAKRQFTATDVSWTDGIEGAQLWPLNFGYWENEGGEGFIFVCEDDFVHVYKDEGSSYDWRHELQLEDNLACIGVAVDPSGSGDFTYVHVTSTHTISGAHWYSVFPNPADECTPSCDDSECGPDGCGGYCGECILCICEDVGCYCEDEALLEDYAAIGDDFHCCTMAKMDEWVTACSESEWDNCDDLLGDWCDTIRTNVELSCCYMKYFEEECEAECTWNVATDVCEEPSESAPEDVIVADPDGDSSVAIEDNPVYSDGSTDSSADSGVDATTEPTEPTEPGTFVCLWDTVEGNGPYRMVAEGSEVGQEQECIADTIGFGSNKMFAVPMDCTGAHAYEFQWATNPVTEFDPCGTDVLVLDGAKGDDLILGVAIPAGTTASEVVITSEPTPESIDPSSGPFIESPWDVQIFGQNFGNVMACELNYVDISRDTEIVDGVVTGDSVQCQLPELGSETVVDIRLANADASTVQDFPTLLSSDKTSFEYLPNRCSSDRTMDAMHAIIEDGFGETEAGELCSWTVAPASEPKGISFRVSEFDLGDGQCTNAKVQIAVDGELVCELCAGQVNATCPGSAPTPPQDTACASFDQSSGVSCYGTSEVTVTYQSSTGGASGFKLEYSAVPDVFIAEDSLYRLDESSTYSVVGSNFPQTLDLECEARVVYENATIVSARLAVENRGGNDIDCAFPKGMLQYPGGGDANATVWLLEGGQTKESSLVQIILTEALEVEGCSPGERFANAQYDSCTPCDKGTYSDTYGAVQCLDCPSGTVSEDSGATSCVECLAGTRSSAEIRSTLCINCEANTYQNATGQSACMSCDDTRQSDSGSDSIADCICRDNFYENNQTACVTCPESAYCRAGVQPVPASGYWSSGVTDPASFTACPAKEACVGGLTSACAEGYTGVYCSSCDSGYYAFGHFCEKCPESNSGILIGVMLLAGVIATFILVRFAGGVDLGGFGSLPVAFSSLQLTSVLSGFEIEWPDPLKQFWEALAIVTFDVELAQPECVGDFTFTRKWEITVLLPFVFLFFLLIVYGSHAMTWAIKRWRKKDICLKQEASFLFQRCVNSFLVLMSLLFVILADKALVPFDCTEDGEGTLHLDSEPSIVCDFDDEDFAWLFPRAIVCSLFYVLGIPIGLFAILYYKRYELSDPEVRRTLGLLYNKYEYRFYYWEIAVMMRKFGFVVGQRFFNTEPLIQVTLGMAIILAAFTADVRLTPFYSDLHDILDLGLLFTNFLVLWAAMLFLSDSWPQPQEESQEVAGLVLLSVLLSSIASVLFAVVFELKRKYYILVQSRKWEANHDYEKDYATIEDIFDEGGEMFALALREVVHEPAVPFLISYLFHSKRRGEDISWIHNLVEVLNVKDDLNVQEEIFAVRELHRMAERAQMLRMRMVESDSRGCQIPLFNRKKKAVAIFPEDEKPVIPEKANAFEEESSTSDEPNKEKLGDPDDSARNSARTADSEMGEEPVLQPQRQKSEVETRSRTSYDPSTTEEDSSNLTNAQSTIRTLPSLQMNATAEFEHQPGALSPQSQGDFADGALLVTPKQK